SQSRVAFARMVSNTGRRSVGELLMMLRTSEVAFSRSRDSLSSRASSAVSFLSPVRADFTVAVRRGGFPMRRFDLGRFVRPVATPSPNQLRYGQRLADWSHRISPHRQSGAPRRAIQLTAELAQPQVQTGKRRILSHVNG